MVNRLVGWIGRHRIAALVAALLLAALVAGGAALAWRHAQRDRAEGSTVPALVASSTGASARGDASPVSYPGQEGQGEGQEPLVIRLSEGREGAVGGEALPVAGGQPLSGDEVARILARLPALETEAGDEADFRLPDESPPPPRTGETIRETFPPPPVPVTPKAVETGPLQVVRYAPEGDITLAPFVQVTFNQPMVPLATLGTLAAAKVPARLEPALPGTWQWLGTKTLTFEYQSTPETVLGAEPYSASIDRLPKATEYVVTVPAGTRSATGGELVEAVSWTFRTPPPRMATYYPSTDPQPLEPLFLVAFDQRIEPAAVLETIQVTAGGQAVPVRLADAEEVQADKAAMRLAENAGEGRWLAFVAREPLPADAAIQVTVGPGTPSAEGPLVTQEAQSYAFRTYAPLRVREHRCSWYSDECPPLAPWVIEFNNPLDVDAYQESMVRVEPALPGATVDVAGGAITIRGGTAGRTTYQVTIDGALQDTFGQMLGKEARLSFKVGSAEPALLGPDEALVTLDPALKEPALSVYAINYGRLKARAYRVEPADWSAFKDYMQNWYREDNPPQPPGRLAMDRVVEVEAAADVLAEVRIDLRQALGGDVGHLVVVVEPEGPKPANRWERHIVQAWVQVTRIGLDAFTDQDEMVVWATALEDGAPRAGVAIATGSGRELATTGQDGTARFELAGGRINLLVARGPEYPSGGPDLAILPRYSYTWRDDGWEPRPVQDGLRWYVFDDRGVYRPGEEVHVKGWLRLVGGGPDGDVGLPGDAVQSLSYRVSDPQGVELLSGEAPANALGGFDLAFTLPDNANLGGATLTLSARGSLAGLSGLEYYHRFQVLEFRRPEFEVSAWPETPGPYFADGEATVAVDANYYAGGGLPNAEVTWQVSASPGSYVPPNWPGFTFGRWTPWWYRYEAGYDYEYWPPPREQSVQTFAGATDAAGSHYLRLEFDPPGTLQPYTVLAEATVMDVNRQAWAATTSLLVHPAELYVGLRSERTFVERGKPLVIDVIVVDLDGLPEPDRLVQVRAARLEWKTVRGVWQQEAVDVQECTVGSTEEPVSCTFDTDVGGEYEITATVTDAFGRENESQFTRWVSGGRRPAARQVEQEEVTLIPDRESYGAGDVAEILVQAPFSPAEGLLTVSRSGILYTERFRIEEDTITLRVPVEEEHVPNLHVQVDLVGAAPRTDEAAEGAADLPLRPAYASGQLGLSVPPLQRTLALAVRPREMELEPGGETTIDLVLTDAAGQPVADAELAVVVVDEAILALSNYSLADPVAGFYLARNSGVESRYGRDSIVLANPEALEAEGVPQTVVETVAVEREVMATAMPLPTMTPAVEGAVDEGAAAEPIQVRTDLVPLATFAPEVRTGADGRASVSVTLPDNLTRYRVMVVAVAGGKEFGSAEANLVARLPLMVRPSAPRFLNLSDRFELPVVVQNQTDQPLTVDVALRATNLALTGDAGRRVTVPARDRVEVRFPATTDSPGTARFQVAAVAGAFADAAAGEMPVYTPATTEAFATYGTVDEGAVAQPVTAPDDEVFHQFGGLEITTSSTALQALTDAVLYLTSYRFECSEQLASRILAVAALRDVLEAFSAAGLPSPEEMQAAVERDIERLRGLQNYDGGFPTWERGKESIPFNTIHVAHALQRAEEMDFLVPPEMRSAALSYLHDIESHYPEWYGEQTRQVLSAYALYARGLMGDGDAAKARQLLSQTSLEGLPLDAVAWLWLALDDDPDSQAKLEAIRRHVGNRAVETAGAATFATAYSDQDYLLLRSDRRTDAIVLEALIAGEPGNDLIPKVVNGLLAHRTHGRWGNTQENVFVLLALNRYFRTFEAQTPDFVARLWLGDTYVGEHAYRGRTTERHETMVPMAAIPALVDADGAGLIVSKEGPGRLYYRLGLRYAPTDLALDALDMGFAVQRSYEGVDDPADVVRDEAGVWHIKAGARVRVRLTMVADSRRTHVALVDPLPAGLEIVNPALAVSGDVPRDPNAAGFDSGWWWWGPWYEHQNMRDERAEAFTSLLWEGAYQYSYIARATTPGTFVVPPARAEEMYAPEVFGRSGSDTVMVE